MSVWWCLGVFGVAISGCLSNSTQPPHTSFPRHIIDRMSSCYTRDAFMSRDHVVCREVARCIPSCLTARYTSRDGTTCSRQDGEVHLAPQNTSTDWRKMLHILMHTVLTVFLYYTLLILSLHCREYIGLCGFSILLSSVLLKTRQGATYQSCLLRAITILRRVSLQHPVVTETVL